MKFETYLFDIDHTLYPYSTGIEKWFGDAIGAYVAQKFDVSFEEGLKITEKYYKLFGSTLPGLMYFHELSPREFLDAKGRAPLEVIERVDQDMDEIRALDGRKIAFTNASYSHGVHVLKHLGIFEEFEALYGLDTIGYWGKPHRRSYAHILNASNIDPKTTVFFEDSPRNLRIPYDLGMTTVLIGDLHYAIGNAPEYVSIHAPNLSKALEAVNAI